MSLNEHLLCVGHHAKLFVKCLLFLRKPTTLIQISLPYEYGNRSLEKLSNLSKVTQVLNGRAKI